MRAAFVKQGGGVELKEIQRPEVSKGSILVEMRASGVCGTDIEKVRGRNITSANLGHEAAGLVVESNLDSVPVGSRVVPHHHVACGICNYCIAGAETMCLKFKNSNFVPGGFADEFLVPAYNVENGGVHFFDHKLSFDEASFAEPVACCIRGLDKVLGSDHDVENQLQVAVIGAGPIGLLHMELLRKRFPDCKIVAVDINETRLAFAEKSEKAIPLNSSKINGGLFSQNARSFTRLQDGFELVIVATGAPAIFDESVKCVRKSGDLLLFGAPHRGSKYNLDLSSFFLDELRILSSYSATDKEVETALRWIENGSLNVSKFITGRFGLNKIDEAFSSALLESQVKVLVIP